MNTVEPNQPTQGQRVRVTGQQIMEAYAFEREKLESIQYRLQNMDRILLEVRGSIEALKALQGGETNPQILIPLGAGVFAEANLISKTVKKSLTSNVFKDDSIDSVLKTLEKELKAAEEGKKQVEKEFQESAQNYRTLEQILTNAEKAKRESQKK